MGKAAKEHRAKVAKRNAKIKQQKSGMQKAFDLLLQQQLEKMKEQDVKVEVGGTEVNFEVVEERAIDHAFKFTPNEEASTKINEKFEGNVSFKEQNPKFVSVNQTPIQEFEPEYDSAEYTIEDREEFNQANNDQ
jgi:hypothetical protein